MAETETTRGLISNVVNSIESLIRAVISYEKDNSLDTMGTYYEEKELDESITELVTHITGGQSGAKQR